MAAEIHIMPDTFSDRIVAAKMRQDSSGRLIATTEPVDVTQDAVRAVAYHYYQQANETPEKAVAYEYTLRNGQRIIIKAVIVGGDEE